MSKAPAFQFYPSDWQRDMDDYPLEIEGAWIRICCRLYWSGGTATKTLDEWSRILRENKRKTQQIFDFFLSKNICDLVNLNGSITITSRRIVRDEYIRNIRKEAGIKGGNPNIINKENPENLVKQTIEQNPTPSSSSSSSTSSSLLKKTKTPKRILSDAESVLFNLFWSEYPKKLNKGDAEKAWFQIKPDKELVDRMIENIKQGKGSWGWQKEGGQFIPYPASWLRVKGWENEYEQVQIETGNPADDAARKLQEIYGKNKSSALA